VEKKGKDQYKFLTADSKQQTAEVQVQTQYVAKQAQQTQ
jgi:hypothetical protein